jgi:dTMP kinase
MNKTKPVNKKGFFVAFEGIDGSGKSTQSVLFYKNLKKLGYPVFHTRPGESDKGMVSPVSRAIKKITHDPRNKHLIGVETETLLYMAQASQMISELISPCLDSGDIVVADRYLYSAYALCHYGRGIDWDLLRRIGNFVSGGLAPDVIVLTDLPARLAFERKEKAGKKLGRKELMGPEFFEKVRQGFLKMAKEINPKKWLVVDDTNMSITEAEKYIWEAIYSKIVSRMGAIENG